MATPTARNQEDGAQLHAGKKMIRGEQLAVSTTVMAGRAGGRWIRTMAHVFPQSPLSACLWPSHSPCLLSFPNSLLQMYLGPLGLFISTLTTSLSSTTSHTLINPLRLSAWQVVCLPSSPCLKERVQPCWSLGVTRNAGWWISRWHYGSARHKFQGNTHIMRARM